MSESSSEFIVPKDFSSEWRDITLTQKRKHTCVYTAQRYGRRFVLKALNPEDTQLTDFRLQQEQEFQLGIQLVHPYIAATYSLEEVDGVGPCIVQEWIDGITLGEWFQTKPTKAARKRAFMQILEALEYLHSLQLVHHDLKADNILITRNGSNAKLIDFGLSATDSTLSAVPNDSRIDIEALCRLFNIQGHYANTAELRRAINRRNKLLRLLPTFFSVCLLIVAAILFYLSWQERHAEQQRRERMVAQIDRYIAQEEAEYQELANRPVVYDSHNAADIMAYKEYIDDYGTIRKGYWAIRDSIMATYSEDDPLREQFFHLWNHKEMDLDNELYPQLTGKLKP